MANEVKLKLAIEGGRVVGAELDGVANKLGALDDKARAAASGSDTLGSALKGLITVGAAMALVKMADSVTTLQTQLRLSSNSAAEAGKAYGALFDIAQKGRVSFTELGTTYAAVARSGRELGVSQDRLLNVTKSISQAMTIGGGSAASMQAALVQLGQGLSSGVLRGEELNSIMEQTPRLAKAIADGLGVPIGKLRELGAAGELTSQQVISALEKAGPALAKEMESATLTVGQAFTMLGNSTVKFVGDADKATGASTTLATAMKSASEAMDTVGAAIKNNEAAFAIVTYGLAGPATVAGVYALSAAIGTRLIPALLGAAAAAGPLGWITIALSAMGGAAVAAGNAFTKSNQGMAISAAQLANQIAAIDKNVAAGLNDRGYKASEEDKRASAARREELTEKKKLIDQAMAMRTADEGSASAAQSSRSAHSKLAKDAIKDREDFAKAGEAYLTKEQKNQVTLSTETEKARTLLEKGSITAAQYAERINAVRASFEKKVAAGGITEAAKGLALYNDLVDKSNGLTATYAEDQSKLTAAYNAQKLTLDEYQVSMAALIKQQPYMVEHEKLRLELAKENTKAVDDLFDAQEKLRLKNEDSIKTSRTMLEQIEFETRLLEMNTEQRALATMERELEHQGIVKGTLAYDAYIAKLREAMALKSGKEAGIKAADDLREANKKAAEESGKYWEDSLMRAFESGKGFFQSLWDTIKNTLKTQVLKVGIQAFMGTAGAGASGLAMAGGSGGGSLLGTASTLGQVYNTVTTGFANVAAGASGAFNSFATSAAGQSLGMSSGAVIGNNASAYIAPQMTSGSLAASSAIGTAAGYAAGAAAGLAIGNAIAGEFGSKNTVTAGVIIGSIVGGPIGGAIGGAIGGLVNRAFGMGNTELQSQGTRGTFAASGAFSGQNYANYHQEGGWFRSDKNWTDTSAIDPKTVSSWQNAFIGVKNSVSGMAASMGLATDKIASYTKTIDVAAGTTAEQVTALFTSMADDMARAAAPGIATLAKEGESASATLSRLGTSLATVNQYLSLLDHTLLATSLSGGDAASKLADVFGGLDNFAASTKAYYDTYFTEAERLAQTTEDVAKGLALVGVAMPGTKEAFRAVVTGLDLTSDAGRNTYAVMMALAPEFAQVADAAKTAADASVKLMTDVFDTLDKRLSGLLDSIASERANVAGARDGILNGGPKTYAELQAGVLAAKVALPSDAGVMAAAAAQAAAANNVATKQTALASAQDNQSYINSAYGGNVSSAQTILSNTITKYKDLAAYFQNTASVYAIKVNATGAANNDAYSYNAGTNQLSGWNNISDATQTGRSYGDFLADSQRFKNAMYGNGTVAALTGGNKDLSIAARSVTYAQSSYATALATSVTVTASAQAALTTATAAKATADANAKAAVKAYADAMNQYSGDAEKAVKVLSKLREETVAYYEAQKALASTMVTSSASLRSAVAALSTSQLDPMAATLQKQREFAQSYAMALSTSGADKAGYADKMTAALPALSEALKATSTLRDWSIQSAQLAAQSSTIAAQLDSASAAMNYEAESLGLLGSIDLALGELDTNTSILKNAIDSGTNATAANLRVIAARLGGVPAFSGGGYHSGGIRLVGENGPELEVTGPSRIFNASQIRGAGGQSDNAEIVAELRAIRKENAELRAELRAITIHTANTADATRRMDKNGVLVYTDPAEPLKTQVAA